MDEEKQSIINKNECPKIEMPIDPNILTKYKWNSLNKCCEIVDKCIKDIDKIIEEI